MGLNLTEISQKVLDNNKNAANVFRKMYDLHYNPNPLDIPFEYIDENGNKTTANVPNRSKMQADFENWKQNINLINDKGIIKNLQGKIIAPPTLEATTITVSNVSEFLQAIDYVNRKSFAKGGNYYRT